MLGRRGGGGGGGVCANYIFALSLDPSFMHFVVDKYAWDFYMENANF